MAAPLPVTTHAKWSSAQRARSSAAMRPPARPLVSIRSLLLALSLSLFPVYFTFSPLMRLLSLSLPPSCSLPILLFHMHLRIQTSCINLFNCRRCAFQACLVCVCVPSSRDEFIYSSISSLFYLHLGDSSTRNVMCVCKCIRCLEHFVMRLSYV